MKKNISINISGIIFHIEEDGYENLRKYLDSITKYFSTFEDSSEIMADIESRIAEIFLSKLNEGKQVITAEDVNALITTMGSVSDFKAVEEQDFAQTNTTASEGKRYSEQDSSSTNESYKSNYTYVPPKHLSRDQQRKILGGVCSGLANYMNVDIIWVRLLFAVLAFAWGLTIFVYIIMWIVVPGSHSLTEVEISKKMYRDPERKVLGGVSGGVASYLYIDILAVRVLFVIFSFAGALGIFVYIILWLILPEAKTITDRMQMQGEPVTLSNIESNIKKNQTFDANTSESSLTKVLLFPFRVLGVILQALAKVVVPIIEVLRVAIGIMIILIGIGLAMGVIIGGGVAVGLFSAAIFTPDFHINGESLSIPLEAFTRAFPGWVAVAAFVAAIIPAVFIILLGLSIIARRIVFSSTVGWSLFVLFFICSAILSVGIPKIIFAFKERGEYKTETRYKPSGKTAILRINEVGMDDYNGADLHLKGHSESDFKIVQEFNAQGNTRQKAIENAKMVQYNVSVQDSTLIFDSNILFKDDAIFRAQNLDITLFIPYNYPFVMEEGISRFISEYIDHEYLDGYTWKMTEQGLTCITCPVKEQYEEEANVELRDFNELDLKGIFDVKISYGEFYSVELNGPEEEKQKYNIYRSGETLVIDFEGKKNFNWDLKLDESMRDEVRINITMPNLEKLEATGYGNIDFDEFTVNDIQIDIQGPIEVRGKLNATSVNINLTGKSEVNLRGGAQTLNAELELASELKAFELEVQDAIIEARGASNAEVNVQGNLVMEEGVGSDIDFRGNPNITKHN